MSMMNGLSYGQPAADDLSWRELQTSKGKLKASAIISGLLSGFTMVTMIGVDIEYWGPVRDQLWQGISVIAALQVSFSIYTLMVCLSVLPQLEAFTTPHSLSQPPPHQILRGYIESAWFCSLLGLFLFLLEMALFCYTKFGRVSTGILLFACLFFTSILFALSLSKRSIQSNIPLKSKNNTLKCGKDIIITN